MLQKNVQIVSNFDIIGYFLPSSGELMREYIKWLRGKNSLNFPV